MNDIPRWQRRARALIAGAVVMALLWPWVALVRATTAHDWYAAVKLTVAEAMIGAGFSPDGATNYRSPDGTIHRATRRGVVEYREPNEARERIFYTAVVGALHGGVAGALWVVLWVMFWRAIKGWRILRAEWAARPPGQGPPETRGVVEVPRAAPAYRALESTKTPLLALADTAGTKAESPGTKAESAGAKPKNTDAVAKKRRAKAGDGGKPRASSDASDPDLEDGLAGPDESGDVNWL